MSRGGSLLHPNAIQTRLRSSELRSLARGRLFLDSEPPYITCKAGSTKNRKDARQYIQPGLAAELRRYVATKSRRPPVFAMPGKEDVAAMLRADLADARRAWVASARHDPDEHARRQQSDFLNPENHDGETLKRSDRPARPRRKSLPCQEIAKAGESWRLPA